MPYLEPAVIVRRRERSAIALVAGLPRGIRRGLVASDIPVPGGEDRAGRILGGNVVVIKIRIVPRQRDFGCVPRREQKLSAHVEILRIVLFLAREDVSAPAIALDRKSTRLNSSH